MNEMEIAKANDKLFKLNIELSETKDKEKKEKIEQEIKKIYDDFPMLKED